MIFYPDNRSHPGQWEAVMGRNPSNFKTCGPDCPVESVSWDEVQDFIDELNKNSIGRYALPTEAQWEYAARAGTTSAFAIENSDLEEWIKCEDAGPLKEIAWYCFNSGRRPNEVGTLLPNDEGLYDMHGNVKEWVDDFYDEYPGSDLRDPDFEPYERVVRGVDLKVMLTTPVPQCAFVNFLAHPAETWDSVLSWRITMKTLPVIIRSALFQNLYPIREKPSRCQLKPGKTVSAPGETVYGSATPKKTGSLLKQKEPWVAAPSRSRSLKTRTPNPGRARYTLPMKQ